MESIPDNDYKSLYFVDLDNRKSQFRKALEIVRQHDQMHHHILAAHNKSEELWKKSVEAKEALSTPKRHNQFSSVEDQFNSMHLSNKRCDSVNIKSKKLSQSGLHWSLDSISIQKQIHEYLPLDYSFPNAICIPDHPLSRNIPVTDTVYLIINENEDCSNMLMKSSSFWKYFDQSFENSQVQYKSKDIKELIYDINASSSKFFQNSKSQRYKPFDYDRIHSPEVNSVKIQGIFLAKRADGSDVYQPLCNQSDFFIAFNDMCEKGKYRSACVSIPRVIHGPFIEDKSGFYRCIFRRNCPLLWTRCLYLITKYSEKIKNFLDPVLFNNSHSLFQQHPLRPNHSIVKKLNALVESVFQALSFSSEESKYVSEMTVDIGSLHANENSHDVLRENPDESGLQSCDLTQFRIIQVMNVKYEPRISCARRFAITDISLEHRVQLKQFSANLEKVAVDSGHLDNKLEISSETSYSDSNTSPIGSVGQENEKCANKIIVHDSSSDVSNSEESSVVAYSSSNSSVLGVGSIVSAYDEVFEWTELTTSESLDFDEFTSPKLCAENIKTLLFENSQSNGERCDRRNMSGSSLNYVIRSINNSVENPPKPSSTFEEVLNNQSITLTSTTHSSSTSCASLDDFKRLRKLSSVHQYSDSNQSKTLNLKTPSRPSEPKSSKSLSRRFQIAPELAASNSSNMSECPIETNKDDLSFQIASKLSLQDIFQSKGIYDKINQTYVELESNKPGTESSNEDDCVLIKKPHLTDKYLTRLAEKSQPSYWPSYLPQPKNTPRIVSAKDNASDINLMNATEISDTKRRIINALPEKLAIKLTRVQERQEKAVLKHLNKKKPAKQSISRMSHGPSSFVRSGTRIRKRRTTNVNEDDISNDEPVDICQRVRSQIHIEDIPYNKDQLNLSVEANSMLSDNEILQVKEYDVNDSLDSGSTEGRNRVVQDRSQNSLKLHTSNDSLSDAINILSVSTINDEQNTKSNSKSSASMLKPVAPIEAPNSSISFRRSSMSGKRLGRIRQVLAPKQPTWITDDRLHDMDVRKSIDLSEDANPNWSPVKAKSILSYSPAKMRRNLVVRKPEPPQFGKSPTKLARRYSGYNVVRPTLAELRLPENNKKDSKPFIQCTGSYDTNGHLLPRNTSNLHPIGSSDSVSVEGGKMWGNSWDLTAGDFSSLYHGVDLE